MQPRADRARRTGMWTRAARVPAVNASTNAAEVRVEWPEGQDHPEDVYIDRDPRMVDEESGYTISEVDVR